LKGRRRADVALNAFAGFRGIAPAGGRRKGVTVGEPRDGTRPPGAQKAGAVLSFRPLPRSDTAYQRMYSNMLQR